MDDGFRRRVVQLDADEIAVSSFAGGDIFNRDFMSVSFDDERHRSPFGFCYKFSECRCFRDFDIVEFENSVLIF